MFDEMIIEAEIGDGADDSEHCAMVSRRIGDGGYKIHERDLGDDAPIQRHIYLYCSVNIQAIMTPYLVRIRRSFGSEKIRPEMAAGRRLVGIRSLDRLSITQSRWHCQMPNNPF
jgi:hypothetical protein